MRGVPLHALPGAPQKNRARARFCCVEGDDAQLRSARVRPDELSLAIVLLPPDAEPLAVLPEPLVPESVLPALLAPVVELEPAVPEPEPLAPMVALEPPALFGVPVAPIGVDWELCWPAPTAGSLAAGSGGVLWAIAAPAMVNAAAASRPLREVLVML
jgi:hypothetical protein